jgi:DNA-binding response OmpR family regulator
LSAAGPAEVEARLRLAVPARTTRDTSDGGVLVVGPVEIDAIAYVARVDGRELALTHVEFELLNVFALHAGRALTRGQLLDEAHRHGLDRDERTVDTHVRDLRAKLGHRHRHLIRTVRGVGYLMVRPANLTLDTARDEP